MSELVKPEQQAPQKYEAMNPGALLALAVDRDLDIDKLRQLMELQRDWEAHQARKSFFEAFTNFQEKCPDLRKTKGVEFDTAKGKTSYRYAPLSDITRQIAKTLKEFGLSYRWEIADDRETIKVTFIVSHIGGHSERTIMTASPDTSGSKNPIQARGSAVEYLKRYTLIGGLGLTTADSDVDGQMPEIDIDILHKQYMEHYNQLIRIDPTFNKWHPDQWKTDRTSKVYIRAIGEIRKKLIEVTPKP